MRLTDYHTHTFRCGHAGGMARDYIESALIKGLSSVAVTDHIPIYFLPGDDPLPEFAMAKSELAGYVNEVLGLKEEYASRIEVLLGIEADYIEGREADLEHLLNRYQWDVVLGSVHWVAGDWIDGPSSARRHETEGSEALFNEYYRLLARACKTGLFDVMTHFDLPKKFGHQRPEACRELEMAAVAAAAEATVAIEVSSAGLRKPVREEYPAPELLSRLVLAGVPVVFSSDAHAPAEVGWEIRLMQKKAQQAGARFTATFKNRQRSLEGPGDPARQP